MIENRLKEARKNAGYSAERVAEFLGVSPVTIYRYENGKIKTIPYEFIEPLAKLLSVSPEYLTGWDRYDQSDFIIPDPDTMGKMIQNMSREELEEIVRSYNKIIYGMLKTT